MAIPKNLEILDINGNIRRKTCKRCGRRYNEEMYVSEWGRLHDHCPMCSGWGTKPNYDGLVFCLRGGKIRCERSKKYKKEDW
jgi:NAD-dependent SIR2 family protein deacetylase